MILLAASYLSGCLFFAEAPAAASQRAARTANREARTAVVTAIVDPIHIDGVLDEPIWSSAPKIGDLIQRQPVPGSTPSERTEVTLLRDEDNLYIGVMAYDSEPQAVIGTQMARDAGLGSDDRIEILLDTFRDQRNAFYFATNPSGALVDGLTFANGELNTDWDAIWRVRCPHETHSARLDRGVCDSIQESELPRRTNRMGIQLLPQHLSKARRYALVRCSPGNRVPTSVRGG
jgi:hypothetical protein